MNFIIDKEINLAHDGEEQKVDLLHTKRYADLLIKSVKDAPNGEPYTIGLFGEWGSGKSSVIKTMTDSINADPELKKVKVVTYDAWKYAGDSFRRMFLYELRNALGMGESPLMQRFYVNETHETKIKTSVNWKKVGIVVAFVSLSVIAVWIIDTLLGKEVAIPTTIALIALLFSLYSFIFDQLKVSVNKPLLFAPEQFEACYKEMVGCATKWDRNKESALKWITLGLHHEQYLRLVIVVDNIDRCQADKAYTLLTDIKNFLCKEFDVIFIVPVDIEALRKHIIKSSSDHQSLEADEFLRKFFNTSVWMKPYQNDEMYDFAYNLSTRNGLNFKPDTISLVANEFATNPRRIIQLYNNLQIDLAGYESAFAEEHQTLICKILILREEFPAYYKRLLADPKLLYVDVETIRNTESSRLSDDEEALVSNRRLMAFLLATAGVSSRYAQQYDVVARILVNSQIKNNLPENVRQAYRLADAEALAAFAQEEKNRKLLVDYLQDNIKKMSCRGTYEAEGKSNISVLLILFEKGLLTLEDKNRLISPLASVSAFGKCIALFRDKTSLIRFGVDLEAIHIPELSDVIVSYLKSVYATEQDFTDTDIQNIYYALSVWNADKCKKIADVFFKAIQIEPVGFRQYDYSKEKLAILLTDKVFNYLFDNLKVEGCSDDSSPFRVFYHLCHLQAVDKESLLQFMKKAIEIAPSFDCNNPQKIEPTAYLKVLKEIFGELRYLGYPVPLVTMTQLFDKVNAANSVTTNPTFNRTVTTVHSLVTDNAGDEYCANIISQFFINANLITDGSVISNAEIERFMEVEQNHDRILDAIMYLKGQGKDITTWTNAVIKDSRRTDIRRVEILKFAFVQKGNEGQYEVDEAVVKNEIAELINVIQRNEDGSNSVVEMLQSIIVDERVDQIVRSILSQKTLDEQKQLPVVLMHRAITSFEKNINALGIPGDINVLQLLESHGSESGMEGVWEKVNPILADGKNQSQANVNGAIQILLSFSKLTKDQADALAANVKTLPAGKLAEEKKKEVLGFLKGLKNIS